jgi:hypothetical protein
MLHGEEVVLMEYIALTLIVVLLLIVALKSK